MALQSCLFSESSVVETGLWCELHEGVNPQLWARICRFIGHQPPQTFAALAKQILGYCPSTPATSSAESQESTSQSQPPLISLGPSGIGGAYQREF